MSTRRMNIGKSILALVAGLAMAVPASAQQPQESEIARSMGITQKLGAPVPKDVPFVDEYGTPIVLGDLLGKRPVVIIPLFYKCQTGCALITDSLMKTLAKGTTGDILRVGRDLDIVMLGIHPKEKPELAANKKRLILNALAVPGKGMLREDLEANWHTLTGTEENIRKVTDAIGFKYYYNEAKDLVRHPTMSVIVTPDGKISSYTIGNNFPTKVLQEDLRIASKNEIGVKADQSFLFGCIMLDPATGKTRLVVENIVRLAGVVTLLVLVTAIVRMSLKHRSSDEDSLEGGSGAH
jgi:protein SCO1